MLREINVNTDKVTIVNGNNWKNITSIDFGGTEVLFSGQDSGNAPFRNNTTITSLINGTILNDNGHNMFFSCTTLTDFAVDLPNLTAGNLMFQNCTSLTSFTSNLQNLENGSSMFNICRNLTDFTSELPNLTSGNSMFYGCTSLTSFTSDLQNLTNGKDMFNGCSALQSFASDLQNLTNGNYMFNGCSALQSFKSDLPNLTAGASRMFIGCTSLTDFYVAELPKDYNIFLNLSACPLSDLSWLYMATNCPVVEEARGGCTLEANIPNSGDTTVQAILNYFIDKGYRISGYKMQIPNTYYCTEIRDDATEAWLWNPQGRGFDNEDVVAITNSCINNYFTVNLPYRGGEYWVRIRCYTDQPVTCILEGVEYHLGFMEETDVIHVVK